MSKDTSQSSNNNNIKDNIIDNNIIDKNTYVDFVETFAKNLYKTLDLLTRNPYYVPMYANTLVKDINMHPKKPTMTQLKEWLDNPLSHEKDLRDVALHLEDQIMQYKRSVYQFAKILSFNYYLYPISKVPKEEKDIEEYKKCKAKAYLWLKKFRPKEQFTKAWISTIEEGGKFFYVRESEKYIDLQEMPSDWSMIDGKCSVGFTYAFNMAYFCKIPQEAILLYAPEFAEWFKEFIIEQRKNNLMIYWKRMPIEKSVVFTFDDIHPTLAPPLMGVFKDALQIQEYKDLLKTKTQLSTYQLLMQEIPKDSDGKPTIDPTLAAQFVALVQAVLPLGVITASSPMKTESLKFTESQTQNNITGLGEELFWESVGISAVQFGKTSNSVATLKYSNESDYLFVNSFYEQCNRFVNYQLSLVTGKFQFGVKFFGNAYEIDEDIDRNLKAAQYGMPKKKLIASLGYEPYEYENLLDDENLEGLNDGSKLVPLISSHTISGNDVGRPSVGLNKLTDSGLRTIDKGSNIEKK